MSARERRRRAGRPRRPDRHPARLGVADCAAGAGPTVRGRRRRPAPPPPCPPPRADDRPRLASHLLSLAADSSPDAVEELAEDRPWEDVSTYIFELDARIQDSLTTRSDAYLSPAAWPSATGDSHGHRLEYDGEDTGLLPSCRPPRRLTRSRPLTHKRPPPPPPHDAPADPPPPPPPPPPPRHPPASPPPPPSAPHNSPPPPPPPLPRRVSPSHLPRPALPVLSSPLRLRPPTDPLRPPPPPPPPPAPEPSWASRKASRSTRAPSLNSWSCLVRSSAWGWRGVGVPDVLADEEVVAGPLDEHPVTESCGVVDGVEAVEEGEVGVALGASEPSQNFANQLPIRASGASSTIVEMWLVGVGEHRAIHGAVVVADQGDRARRRSARRPAGRGRRARRRPGSRRG